MKIVAIIPCRARSTRLYGKPLQLIGGRPILEHLVERLRSVPEIGDIVLAISEGNENMPFGDYAYREHLCYQYGSELDVLARIINAAARVQATTILRVTPDCPFLCTEVLSGLVDAHVGKVADLTVMEGLPLGTFGEIVEIAALRYSHRHGNERHRSAWVTLFIKEHSELFRIQRVPAEPPLARPEVRLTVDYPEDLVVMRRIYDALAEQGKIIPVREIIAFLDGHPEIAAVNQWIEPGEARIWA